MVKSSKEIKELFGDGIVGSHMFWADRQFDVAEAIINFYTSLFKVNLGYMRRFAEALSPQETLPQKHK